LADVLGVHFNAVNHWVNNRNPVPKYVGLVLDLVERNIALRRRLAEAGVSEPDEAD